MTSNINNKNINLNEKILKIENESEILDPEVVNLYNKLNEKCDKIIGKARIRKAKIKAA
jgi:hypothetical protein